jgi:hypothetical protein
VWNDLPCYVSYFWYVHLFLLLISDHAVSTVGSGTCTLVLFSCGSSGGFCKVNFWMFCLWENVSAWQHEQCGLAGWINGRGQVRFFKLSSFFAHQLQIDNVFRQVPVPPTSADPVHFGPNPDPTSGIYRSRI